MDMTQYAGSESKYLKADDLKGKTPTVIIEAVELVQFDKDDGSKETKPAVKFRGKDKLMVMNATNTEKLMIKFGADSESWIGQSVLLDSEFYPKFGKKGLILMALDKNDDPDDSIPF